jgi:hypothetical protein
MKLFRLHRYKDVTGKSGTGVVALGTEFPNGKCVMSWRTEKATITVSDSLSVLEDLHGHEGATKVEVLDLHPLIQTIIEEFEEGADAEKLKEMMELIIKKTAKIKKEKT